MRIYLDYNATAPVPPEVGGRSGACPPRRCRAIRRRSTPSASGPRPCSTTPGRPSRPSSTPTRARSSSRPAAPRPTTSRCAAPPKRSRATGRRHIVTTGIEHEAVLNTLKALERQGCTVDGPAGRRVGRPGARRARARRSTRETGLVSVMHANNEVGTIQPIAELAAIARSHRRALSHRRRAGGRQDSRLGARASASICSRSPATSSAARRASARSGSAAACAWSRTMTGGRQERNRRAGTENVPAIAGLGVAARARARTPRRRTPTSIARAARSARARHPRGGAGHGRQRRPRRGACRTRRTSASTASRPSRC